MRLIDADALVNAFNEAQVEFDEYYKGLGRAKVITDNAPTVDAVVNTIEVRPQGKWIDRMADKGYVECPFCHKQITGGDLNFCVKCGADMRKSDTE